MQTPHLTQPDNISSPSRDRALWAQGVVARRSCRRATRRSSSPSPGPIALGRACTGAFMRLQRASRDFVPGDLRAVLIYCTALIKP